MPAELLVGDPAPDFRATATGGDGPPEGRSIGLGDLRGGRVVLLFYPSNDIPGNTGQLCALRDAWDEIRARATVFGVNHDTPGEHRRLIQQLALPFLLLSDEDHRIASAYGLWFGDEGGGDVEGGESTARATFILDADGRVEGMWRDADAGTHVPWLRKALRP